MLCCITCSFFKERLLLSCLYSHFVVVLEKQVQYNKYNTIIEHVSTPVPTISITVSLVGAATSIIFVMTNTCLHMFVTKVLS